MPYRNYIALWREHRGLTQQQLADRLGTSNQQVSRLELGQRNLKECWLRRLASVLDCTVDDLLNRPPMRRSADAGQPAEEDDVRTEQLILQNLRELNARQAEQTALLRAMLDALRDPASEPGDPTSRDRRPLAAAG